MKKTFQIILVGAVGISAAATVFAMQHQMSASSGEQVIVAQSDDFSPVCETPYGYCYVPALPIGSPCWCETESGGVVEGYIVPE